MIEENVTPIFGQNYFRGDIGFTYNDQNIISQGIALLTQSDKRGESVATHVFIVESKWDCLEAHLETGVARNPIQHYFDDPHQVVFFRRLRGHNEIMIDRIIERAIPLIGSEYDTSLIIAAAINGFIANRIKNKAIRSKLSKARDVVVGLFNNPDSYICSEFIAKILRPEFVDYDLFSQPVAAITPQELLESDICAEKLYSG